MIEGPTQHEITLLQNRDDDHEHREPQLTLLWESLRGEALPGTRDRGVRKTERAYVSLSVKTREPSHKKHSSEIIVSQDWPYKRQDDQGIYGSVYVLFTCWVYKVHWVDMRNGRGLVPDITADCHLQANASGNCFPLGARSP